MFLLFTLLLPHVFSSTLGSELEGYVKSYRLCHGPSASELVGPVAELTKSAAKNGKTRIDIDWREFAPIKEWLNAGGVNRDGLTTTVKHIGDSFEVYWKSLYDDFHVAHIDDTMSLCWMNDKSCWHDVLNWFNYQANKNKIP